MTLAAMIDLTLMIGVGSYLAFGPRVAGFFLLGWAAIHIAGNAMRRP